MNDIKKIRLEQEQIDMLFQEGIIKTELYIKNPDIELQYINENKILLTAYKKGKEENKKYELDYCPRTKFYMTKGIKRAHKNCKYCKYGICTYRYGLIKYFENIDIGNKKFQFTNCILLKKKISEK